MESNLQVIHPDSVKSDTTTHSVSKNRASSSTDQIIHENKQNQQLSVPLSNISNQRSNSIGLSILYATQNHGDNNWPTLDKDNLINDSTFLSN